MLINRTFSHIRTLQVDPSVDDKLDISDVSVHNRRRVKVKGGLKVDPILSASNFANPQ